MRYMMNGQWKMKMEREARDRLWIDFACHLKGLLGFYPTGNKGHLKSFKLESIIVSF